MAVPNFAPPEAPSFNSPREKTILADRIQLHNGIQQVRSLNIRPMQSFQLRWELAEEETKEYIESFVDGLNGSPGPFTWIPWDRIASPTGAPLVAEQVAGGALGARTLYFAYSFFHNATGQETKISTEQSLAVDANKYLKVTLPAPVPSGADKWRFYVSATSGALKRETTIDKSTNAYTLSGNPTGTEDPPTANTLFPQSMRFLMQDRLRVTPLIDNLWNVRMNIIESFI